MKIPFKIATTAYPDIEKQDNPGATCAQSVRGDTIEGRTGLDTVPSRVLSVPAANIKIPRDRRAVQHGERVTQARKERVGLPLRIQCVQAATQGSI